MRNIIILLYALALALAGCGHDTTNDVVSEVTSTVTVTAPCTQPTPTHHPCTQEGVEP